MTEYLYQKSVAILHRLCNEFPNRSVGSEANRKATQFIRDALASLGWELQAQEFDAIDWEEGEAQLQAGESSFEVRASPYSIGCDVAGPLACVASIAELEAVDLSGKLVLLHGPIAQEQLTPKNFVFYNPEEHQRIISLLEQGRPQAILCATGKNSATSGGVYPFPLIEDGDFDLPSVYMTEEEGQRLFSHAGEMVHLKSSARRIPAKGENVIARKGKQPLDRVVITAHIDTKKSTPGAIDNATGVVVLLLVAELLKDHLSDQMIEIVAFNGEDYYAVPGQMRYIEQNYGHFSEMMLDINLDGVGYHTGGTAFSLYGLPPEMEAQARAVLGSSPELVEGPQWPQGDHSIFVQMGCPAIAVTSSWFTDHMDSQEITHTPKDNPEIVDCHKLVEIAQVLAAFVQKVSKG